MRRVWAGALSSPYLFPLLVTYFVACYVYISGRGQCTPLAACVCCVTPCASCIFLRQEKNNGLDQRDRPGVSSLLE